MSYEAFLERKAIVAPERGLRDVPELHPDAFPHQRDVTDFLLRVGCGLNWQHCARVAFAGLSFSYEQFYQAVRRCWRFGQQRPVHVHVAMASTEEAIWRAVQRKQSDHEDMKRHMYAAMKRAVEVRDVKINYRPTLPAQLPAWL